MQGRSTGCFCNSSSFSNVASLHSVSLNNKRILVTGGAGFLGRFVVERLKAIGVRQIIVPRSRDYDLCNQQSTRQLFQASRPEIVIHLAAHVGGIGMNLNQPGELFYRNAIMGIECMEQARLSHVEKFVGISTVCCYPKFTTVPFQESALWDGYPEETNAPYGLAKKMLLVQGQAYRRQYGFRAICLLPVNLYGPGDNFDLNNSHIIPALIRKFSEAVWEGSTEVTLWGDGTPTREFLYVADAANAIVLAAEHYDRAEPMNLGSGKEIAIRTLATLIAEEIGFHGTIRWDHTRPNGQPRRCLDVSRAKEDLGFEAQTELRIGLRQTIAWYHSHFAPPPSEQPLPILQP